MTTIRKKKVPGTKFGKPRENSEGSEEGKRTGRGRYCENRENATTQTVYDHGGGLYVALQNGHLACLDETAESRR